MCTSTCSSCFQCREYCSCPAAPVYNNCSSTYGCLQKMDTACVIYKFNSPTAVSNLTNLKLPVLTTVEQFMEAVDQRLGNLDSSQVTDLTTKFNQLNTPVVSTCFQTIYGALASNTLAGLTSKIQDVLCQIYTKPSTDTDEKVKVSVYDKGTQYLFDKLVVSGPLVKSIDNPAQIESLRIGLDIGQLLQLINQDNILTGLFCQIVSKCPRPTCIDVTYSPAGSGGSSGTVPDYKGYYLSVSS